MSENTNKNELLSVNKIAEMTGKDRRTVKKIMMLFSDEAEMINGKPRWTAGTVERAFIGEEEKPLANAPLIWASLSIVCVYLAGLAAYLTIACLKAKPVQPPSNEPKCLKLQKGYSSEEIRESELDNLQKRIDFNQARNVNTGKHLNRVRLLICATPLVAIVAAFILALLG